MLISERSLSLSTPPPLTTLPRAMRVGHRRRPITSLRTSQRIRQPGRLYYRLSEPRQCSQSFKTAATATDNAPAGLSRQHHYDARPEGGVKHWVKPTWARSTDLPSHLPDR